MGTQHPATSDLWAGVDVGTQSLRVLLVDDHGAVHGRGAGRLTSHRRGPLHEQDPDQWWQVLGESCRQAFAGGASADRVRGIALCGTSGTFLLADADARPRTPAIMYDDARAGAEAEEVIAAGEQRWASLGYPMQRTWALPKLLWALREYPTDRLVLRHCADYLADQLTGTTVATDWSHALKTGYDLDIDDWPAEVFDKLGIPADTLPGVVRPGTEIGHVGIHGAAHTGLRVGTPVRAGMTDGCAAQIAAGALTPGSWNSVLGTTLVLKGVSDHRLPDSGGIIYSHRHPDSGWLPGGASSVGAGVLEASFPSADRPRLDAAAALHEPAPGFMYPLARRGERFPFVRPDAEAFAVGQLDDPGARYAALLQGIAFVERLCFAYLRRLGARVDGPVSLTGGATRNRYWCQLRADILGHRVVLPGSAEPAFGMAVLAAAGDGPITEAAARMVRTATVIDPRPGIAERFSDTYAAFVDALADRGWIDIGFADYAKVHS